MQKTVNALLSRLSYGDETYIEKGEVSYGVVETLARVYEKARNTMEYRADHLVRRAAIERILKRSFVFDKNPQTLTKHLLTELKWARYLSPGELKLVQEEKLQKVMGKYVDSLNGTVPTDWVIKIASAEIEEMFNLNIDYRQFTFFAFQTIKQKVNIKDENLDLLLFYAVDKIYAESDDEQIAYHLLKLAGSEFTPQKFEESWKLFSLAKQHKLLTKISKYVRRQIPPLILLRDIYFYEPKEFKNTLSDSELFIKRAKEVLDIQLDQMSHRINTAGWRSVVYIFLTKMLLAFVMEVPLEILLYGTVAKIPLAINVVFPPLLMWITTLQVHLPAEEERENLVNRSWSIIENFDSLKNEAGVLTESSPQKAGVIYWVFSILYTITFVGIFVLIIFLLNKIGFTPTSMLIFIFFLTIIAFFAYRIGQIAKVYSWKDGEKDTTSFIVIVSLPILTIGSRLSRGLTKLNFLAFTFDFILEAPFKLILNLLDSWVAFLSVKKEEEIIE